MTQDDTRPDPKAQIETLFEVGRLMVEKGLPAVRVAVELDGAVSLTLYDGPEHPVSAGYAAGAVAAWGTALGLSDQLAHVESGVRYVSVHGVWAGVRVDLRTSGHVTVAAVTP